MDEQAFKTLGIAPTSDGKAIRAAFLRLARIYHPDRLAEMPDDVRIEAERRMKDATVAYGTLRAAKPAERTPPPVVADDEMRERARKYREAMESRRDEDERNRARWLRWDEIERNARAKAEMEAEIAAAIARDAGVASTPAPAPEPTADEVRPLPPASLLEQRLKAARHGEIASLVPRRQTV